jgi:hypothetical protein
MFRLFETDEVPHALVKASSKIGNEIRATAKAIQY